MIKKTKKILDKMLPKKTHPVKHINEEDLSHTKRFLSNKEAILQRGTSATIRARIKDAGKRFFANDNISEFIKEGEIDQLVEETTIKFYEVLKTILIDVDNDPNSEDTAYRLAKMYVKELLYGRYYKMPAHTVFPNEDIEGQVGEYGSEKYDGMIVIRAELKSICSHHWQPVTLVAYIGIIPNTYMLGLSKYIRIAQHVARRGTLQEQLCTAIAKQIMKTTESKNVAVYLEGFHGCCENRGVMATSSLTQTTYLHGAFKRADLKAEFMNNIQLQKQGTHK